MQRSILEPENPDERLDILGQMLTIATDAASRRKTLDCIVISTCAVLILEIIVIWVISTDVGWKIGCTCVGEFSLYSMLVIILKCGVLMEKEYPDKIEWSSDV